MKRPAKLFSLITATLALPVVLAAPATFAADVVKCIDRDGHVTLTDQPCDTGSTSMTLERGASQPMAPVSAAAPQRKGERERYVLPIVDPVVWKRPDLSRAVPLNGDVATLREARRTLLLQDTRGSLAGLP